MAEMDNYKNDCFPEPVGMWSSIGAFGLLGLGLMTSLGLLVIECLARVLKNKLSPLLSI